MYRFILLLLVPFFSYSQQTIEASIMHDGAERDYLLYVPANYSGDESVPLVLNFHGYGSSNVEQIAYGDFRSIADTAGFIMAVPLGLLYDNSTHWNVGGWIINGTVDDVGFTSELIASIADEYNINLDRVYATGMSNGGFMSFLLACQLSDQIAAIASVTGSMTPQTYDNCSPTHPTPILYIHGDDDSVVPYNGAIWTKPVQTTLDYWIEYNECEEEAILNNIEDINTEDGSTVEQYVFNNVNNHAVVEHFKIVGGDHTWPGTVFDFGGTNQDINASKEIWRFFSQYDINGKVTVGVNEITQAENILFYPNPVVDQIYLDEIISAQADILVYNKLGELVSLNNKVLNNSIDVSHLSPGIYFLSIDTNIQKFVKM